MGNIDSALINEDNDQTSCSRGRFIINFVSAENIPTCDNFIATNSCDPYLKAYLCTQETTSNGSTEEDNAQYTRISEIVVTPKRSNCTNPIWNTYRDFHKDPPAGSFLRVELFDANREKVDKDPLATITVDTEYFADELPKNLLFMGLKCRQSNIRLQLRRVFIEKPAPITKTIFLIRHGESKWNKAQSSGNMLSAILSKDMTVDRDHPLTERGIKQAQYLNRSWKEAAEKLNELTEGDHILNFNYDSFPCNPPNSDLPSARTRSGTRHVPMDTSPDPPTFNHSISLPVPIPDADSPGDGLTTKSPAQSMNTSPIQTPSATIASSPAPCDAATLLQALGDSQKDSSGRDRSGSNPDKDRLRANSRDNSDKNRRHIALAMTPYSSLNSAETHSNASVLSAATAPTYDGDDFAYDDEVDDEVDSPDLSFEDTDEHLTPGGDFYTEELSKRIAQIGAKFNRSLTLNEITARKYEYYRRFMDADYVYCSPLTRAIETALVGLQGHPAIVSNGLKLNSTIREIKGPGGLDCVGVACGEDISDRVAAELEAKVGKERADEIMMRYAHGNDVLDVGDTVSPWWTSATSADNITDQRVRTSEFVSFTRYCDAKMPIFVGHSLFFKQFYSNRHAKYLETIRPSITGDLTKFRLGNASVLAVTLLYSGTSDFDCKILDVDLLYGGYFQKQVLSPGSDYRSSIDRLSEEGNNTLNRSRHNPLPTILGKVSSFSSSFSNIDVSGIGTSWNRIVRPISLNADGEPLTDSSEGRTAAPIGRPHSSSVSSSSSISSSVVNKITSVFKPSIDKS